MWSMQEAVDYYKAQGAPGDQNATVSLLREVQQAFGGAIPQAVLREACELLDAKETYLLAIVKRIPSLRLADTHVLELCSGPNCGKHTALAALAEKLCAKAGVQLKFAPCMRMCGKGPNLKWDGKLYHQADEALLRRLVDGQ